MPGGRPGVSDRCIESFLGVLTEGWRITSAGKMALTCIMLILLSMAFIGLRRLTREYDRLIVRRAFRLHLQHSGGFQSPRRGTGAPTASAATSTPGGMMDGMMDGTCNYMGPATGYPNIRVTRASEVDDSTRGHPGTPVPAPFVTTGSSSPVKEKDADSNFFPYSAVAPTDYVYRPKLTQHLLRTLLYLLQFILFLLLMLTAMSYNGWFCLCMGLGVFLGALLFRFESLDGGYFRH
ncbi:MAG: Copper Transporter integral membrane protein that functions in high affinity copper transport [Claussenomyces sp. TS43310]|nr:MAG: Copper Transporter integral membrane protein that functions in high affinity copper transport [Claussenomyces sp. TS43310]